MTAAAAVLDTTPVSRAAAARIEAAEAEAWRDLVRAAPAEWAAHGGLGAREVGGTLVTRWAASGRRYFSRTIGLGVHEPATEAVLDDILAGWSADGIDRFLVQWQPHCEPAAFEDWLRERGLEPFDRQDRVVRTGSRPLAETGFGAGRAFSVEWVTAASAEEWARFVDRVYDVDTGPWLPALAGRAGWHHALVRENGVLVAARSLFAGAHGGWLCIDAPVPGLRTDDYEPDAIACEALVRRALALGLDLVGADIEAPSAAQDTPAYATFAALGFTVPYAHVHYGRI